MVWVFFGEKESDGLSYALEKGKLKNTSGVRQ